MSTASMSILTAQDAEWEHAHAHSETRSSTPIHGSDDEDVVSVTLSSDAGEDDDDAWEGVYDTDSDYARQSLPSSLVRTPQSRPTAELLPSNDAQADATLDPSMGLDTTMSISSPEVLYTFPDPLSTSSLEADLQSHLTISETDTELLVNLDAESAVLPLSPPNTVAGPSPTSVRLPLRYATGIALAAVLVGCALRSCQVPSSNLPKTAMYGQELLSPKWSDALLGSIFGTTQPCSSSIVPSSAMTARVNPTVSALQHGPLETAALKHSFTPSYQYPLRARCSSTGEDVECNPHVAYHTIAAAETALLIGSTEAHKVAKFATAASMDLYGTTAYPLSLSPFLAIKSALSLAVTRVLLHDFRDILRIVDELLAIIRQYKHSKGILDFIAERHARARRNARRSLNAVTEIFNGNVSMGLQSAFSNGVAVWRDVLDKGVGYLRL